MKRATMIDLFCGRGGWTKGFMAEGWHCIGYDVNPQPEYPGEFIQRDVLELTAADLIRADFICCSSPCEQFSLYRMRHFHPNPPFPALGIRLFEHAQSLCQDSLAPYIMENVYSSQRFVGPAVNHCGPFYLWGTGVPAVMPCELYSLTKGMKFGGGSWVSQMLKAGGRKAVREHRRELEREFLAAKKVSNTHAAAAAIVAEIPVELSRYVARCAHGVCEVHNETRELDTRERASSGVDGAELHRAAVLMRC